MCFEIQYSDLWTYRNGRRVKKNSGKESLELLDSKLYTHIHGELNIIINGEYVPYLGFNKNKDVCFGIWIDELNNVIETFKSKQKEYTVAGWEQGIPAFKFEKEGKLGYLSIIDDIQMQGKFDKDWQKKEFLVEEFYKSFSEFKERLQNDICKECPNMVEKWRERLLIN